MKKLIALSLAVLSLSCAAAPTFAATPQLSDSAVQKVVGGWEMPASYNMSKNENAKAAYKKALAGINTTDKYNAIALLGTQVVAGTNYAVLCRITEMPANNTDSLKTEIKIVYIYEDLKGNAKITGYQTIIGNGSDFGSFKANTGKFGIKKNEDVYESYKAAAAQYAAAGESFGKVKPVAFLGNQVVSGQNHLILCKTQAGWTLITIYEDLKGNSSVTSADILQLGNYDDESLEEDLEYAEDGNDTELTKENLGASNALKPRKR